MYMLQCEDASNLSYCRKDSMMYINQQYDDNYGTRQEKNKCITGNGDTPLIPSVERRGKDIIWSHTKPSTILIHIKICKPQCVIRFVIVPAKVNLHCSNRENS